MQSKSEIQCKVCPASFPTIKECLAHELLQHVNSPSTQKSFRPTIKTITKLLASDKTTTERAELQTALERAQNGQHLSTVLDLFRGDRDKFESSFVHVRRCIEEELPFRTRVRPFGSLVTTLALKDSDIDLFLESCEPKLRNLMHKKFLKTVCNSLRRSKCFSDVFAIMHARVPIIKCKHLLTGLSLDINMTNPNSLYNSRFVADIMEFDVRLHELFLFIKIWGKKTAIVGNGRMTSYCLIVLIIYYLQQKRFLPSIRDTQANCTPFLVMGINYAFSLRDVKSLPNHLTTLDLIRGFFEFYNDCKFDKVVLAPYLGYSIGVEEAFNTPGGYPEYQGQIQALLLARGEQPEPFQSQRDICVQDPFELAHNVAKSITQSVLIYFRQCLMLATQAINDPELIGSPVKLFDYLIFGIPQELLKDRRAMQARPAKQRKQFKFNEDSLMNSNKNANASENSNESRIENASESGKINNSSSSMKHVAIIRSSPNELKHLRLEYLDGKVKSKYTLDSYWASCCTKVIKDIVSQIYAFDMQLIEGSDIGGTWHIKTNIDTWTGRKFQQNRYQSFYAYQLQQTREYIDLRRTEAQVVGILFLEANNDYTELRMELQPMTGDWTGMLRNSPLTKFFKSLKNTVNNFGFKRTFNN